ncbi:MAG: ferredoxin family protein [Candidatus Jordarchaeaceae archaeon]
MGLRVRIDIDYQKCTRPFVCKKCIDICPGKVFLVTPNPMMIRKYQPVDENQPGSYLLFAPMTLKCVGCMECEKICPSSALKVMIEQTGPEIQTIS